MLKMLKRKIQEEIKDFKRFVQWIRTGNAQRVTAVVYDCNGSELTTTIAY